MLLLFFVQIDHCLCHHYVDLIVSDFALVEQNQIEDVNVLSLVDIYDVHLVIYFFECSFHARSKCLRESISFFLALRFQLLPLRALEFPVMIALFCFRRKNFKKVFFVSLIFISKVK